MMRWRWVYKLTARTRMDIYSKLLANIYIKKIFFLLNILCERYGLVLSTSTISV